MMTTDGALTSPKVRCSTNANFSPSSRILGDQLTVAYGPDAETLCYGVITTLNLAVERHADDTGESPDPNLTPIPLTSL
jgi:hypothetical protein